jgi:hypothetical protein
MAAQVAHQLVPPVAHQLAVAAVLLTVAALATAAPVEALALAAAVALQVLTAALVEATLEPMADLAAQ